MRLVSTARLRAPGAGGAGRARRGRRSGGDRGRDLEPPDRRGARNGRRDAATNSSTASPTPPSSTPRSPIGSRSEPNRFNATPRRLVCGARGHDLHARGRLAYGRLPGEVRRHDGDGRLCGAVRQHGGRVRRPARARRHPSLDPDPADRLPGRKRRCGRRAGARAEWRDLSLGPRSRRDLPRQRCGRTQSSRSRPARSTGSSGRANPSRRSRLSRSKL